MASAPFSVKLVLVTGQHVLVEHNAKGFRFPVYLSKKRELPQDTAKRMFGVLCGEKPERIVSLPIITRIAVEDIPEEESAGWPSGAKTIPCVAFSYALEKAPEKPIGFSWVGKEEAFQLLFENSDKEVLASLD